MSDLEKLLKHHPTFLHHQDIVDICKPLEFLNITSFSNVRVSSEQSFTAISSNPEFARNYILKEHYKADVHVEKDHSPILNCLIWDNIETHGQATQMVQEASELDCNHIFTMIKAHGHQIDYYNFGTKLNDKSINQAYINHYDLLEKFIEYFNESIHKSPQLKKAYNIQMPMQQQTMVADHFSHTLLSNEKIAAFLNAIQSEKYVKFSRREISIIPLIVQGYTAKEIAEIFKISFRTVEGYIDSLKYKLNARNKAELINKLIHNSIIG